MDLQPLRLDDVVTALQLLREALGGLLRQLLTLRELLEAAEVLLIHLDPHLMMQHHDHNNKNK